MIRGVSDCRRLTALSVVRTRLEGVAINRAAAHKRRIASALRLLSFQQDIVSFCIAVVVLQVRSNRLADLKPLVPSLLSAIEATAPGTAEFNGQP